VNDDVSVAIPTPRKVASSRYRSVGAFDACGAA